MTNYESFDSGVNRVWREGDIIFRPAQNWSPAMAALLDHCEQVGLEFTQRILKLGDKYDEFQFIKGQVGHYPLSANVKSEKTLIDYATKLRRFHDASTALIEKKLDWQFSAIRPVEIIAHGDPAPYNCVFEGEKIIGLIDFDGARPAPRSWDLAQAFYRWLPLTDRNHEEYFGTPADQRKRLEIFQKAYGATNQLIDQTLDILPTYLQTLIDWMYETAPKNPAVAKNIREGHAEIYKRDLIYVQNWINNYRRQ